MNDIIRDMMIACEAVGARHSAQILQNCRLYAVRAAKSVRMSAARMDARVANLTPIIEYITMMRTVGSAVSCMRRSRAF
jgi:hypothetical protein